MTDRDVTMAMCPHCEQPVQPSLHTTVQCLDNMRAQRDEAREIARHLLGAHMLLGGDPTQLHAEYDWLKPASNR